MQPHSVSGGCEWPGASVCLFALVKISSSKRPKTELQAEVPPGRFLCSGTVRARKLVRAREWHLRVVEAVGNLHRALASCVKVTGAHTHSSYQAPDYGSRKYDAEEAKGDGFSKRFEARESTEDTQHAVVVNDYRFRVVWSGRGEGNETEKSVNLFENATK